MNRETFRIAKDHKNREYVYQHVDELDKHHRENADPNRSGTDGRMYSVPGNAKLIKKKLLQSVHNEPIQKFNFCPRKSSASS
jgi:hypothetical protein